MNIFAIHLCEYLPVFIEMRQGKRYKSPFTTQSSFKRILEVNMVDYKSKALESNPLFTLLQNKYKHAKEKRRENVTTKREAKESLTYYPLLLVNLRLSYFA